MVDGTQSPSAREENQADLLRIAQAGIHDPDPAARLACGLGPGPFAQICMFVSPDADFDALTAAMAVRFPDAQVLACTTAGEIGSDGYEDGQVIALGFPADHFSVRVVTIEGLDQLSHQDEIGRVIRARMELNGASSGMDSEFAFLMVDGLSRREDELAGMLSSGLGGVPVFGGSAGDGTRFQATRLSLNGRSFANAGILSLVRSDCPVRVFSLDHLTPTSHRMVVTEADPSLRIVRKINAEPAAAEYARIVGKDPMQLDQFTFAAHPVVVRLGDRHHVRAIQQVTAEGELVFFSAIDEGMVLTLAEPENLAHHLEAELGNLATAGAPAAIIACDCILRRLEAGQKQQTRELSEVLRRHRVAGFSTYGEQIGALHVNHTMTGVALYPPMRSPAPAHDAD